MDRRMRWGLARFAKACIAAAIVATVSTVHATSFSFDVSDLWWDSSESGWGIQLVQQHQTVFATMYVYRPDSTTDFYVAVLDPAGPSKWSGPVYHTTGPWFGGAWNPANVVESIVGSMTFTLKSFYTGELTYTIGPVAVVKNLIRMSFANDHVGGNWFGAATVTTTSGPCASTGPVPVVAQFTHAGGEAFTGTLATPAGTYTITGTYGQRGRFGDVFGTYTSTQGESGIALVSSIVVSTSTITFHYYFNGSGPGYSCVYQGDFGGTRG